MTVHRLTRKQARRLAVRAQLLDGRTPRTLVEMVEHLTLLQIDPTAAIAPSRPGGLEPDGFVLPAGSSTHGIRSRRTLFEFDGFIRPMGDLELFLAR